MKTVTLSFQALAGTPDAEITLASNQELMSVETMAHDIDAEVTFFVVVSTTDNSDSDGVVPS